MALLQSCVSEASPPTCTCGHDRHAKGVVKPESSYGFWGWIALGMGATVFPRRIAFRCVRCGEIFDETTDRKEIEAIAD